MVVIKFIILLSFLSIALSLPVVDKGVFVITGVKTCGSGSGYCILGADCTVDKEFIPDEANGHCDGLRKAFTPRAFFVCCQVLNNDQINSTTTTIAPITSTTIPSISVESVESVESRSDEESVEEIDSDEITSTTEGLTDLLRIDNDIGVTLDSFDDIVTSTIASTIASNTITTTTTPKETTEPEVIEEVQVSVSNTVDVNYTSCSNKYNRIDNSRLAASETRESGVCWTGAITRTTSGLSPFPDPGSFICSGALISNNLLLTTATCVSRLFGQQEQYKVALGSRHLLHPINGPTQDADYRDIKELIIHEEYDVQHGLVRVNDIALVRLSEGVNIGRYCTVCLPENQNEFHSGEECVVSGFSHPTNSQQLLNVVESDGILHEASQYIEYSSNCDNVLSNYTTSSNNGLNGNGLICASGKHSAEACFSPRDAGSPLACPILSEDGSQLGYKLVGVFSSGFHCGTSSMPVLYTDVSHHIKWIQQFL